MPRCNSLACDTCLRTRRRAARALERRGSKRGDGVKCAFADVDSAGLVNLMVAKVQAPHRARAQPRSLAGHNESVTLPFLPCGSITLIVKLRVTVNYGVNYRPRALLSQHSPRLRRGPRGRRCVAADACEVARSGGSNGARRAPDVVPSFVDPSREISLNARDGDVIPPPSRPDRALIFSGSRRKSVGVVEGKRRPGNGRFARSCDLHSRNYTRELCSRDFSPAELGETTASETVMMLR